MSRWRGYGTTEIDLRSQAVRLLRLSIIGGAMVAAACTPQSPPDPEFVRSAITPSSDTPLFIDGSVLASCGGQELFALSVTVDPQAKYSPGHTYTFAEKFRNGPAPMQPYAGNVRAYILRGNGTNLVGKTVSPEFICYYEVKSGQLRYLTRLSPDGDGRVTITEYSQAALESYAIMAGKNVGAVKLFGAYAN